MSAFGITQYAKVYASKLSGGNKRKLCAAMALIGKPLIVFSDEQSAGVDPASRRQMWKVIKQLSKESSMIVTTHSMEEAEALATKVGIMVNGELKCFGTVPHLKDKFGKGYEIEFKIDMDRIERKDDKVHEPKTTSTDKVIECLRNIDEAMVKEFAEHGALKNFYLKVSTMIILCIVTKSMFNRCVSSIENSLLTISTKQNH